jgi:hypothetical protein
MPGDGGSWSRALEKWMDKCQQCSLSNRLGVTPARSTGGYFTQRKAIFGSQAGQLIAVKYRK